MSLLLSLFNILFAALAIVFAWAACAELVAALRVRYRPVLYRAVAHSILSAALFVRVASLFPQDTETLYDVLFVAGILLDFWLTTRYDFNAELSKRGLPPRKLLLLQKPESASSAKSP